MLEGCDYPGSASIEGMPSDRAWKIIIDLVNHENNRENHFKKDDHLHRLLQIASTTIDRDVLEKFLDMQQPDFNTIIAPAVLHCRNMARIRDTAINKAKSDNTGISGILRLIRQVLSGSLFCLKKEDLRYAPKDAETPHISPGQLIDPDIHGTSKTLRTIFDGYPINTRHDGREGKSLSEKRSELVKRALNTGSVEAMSDIFLALFRKNDDAGEVYSLIMSDLPNIDEDQKKLIEEAVIKAFGMVSYYTKTFFPKIANMYVNKNQTLTISTSHGYINLPGGTPLRIKGNYLKEGREIIEIEVTLDGTEVIATLSDPKDLLKLYSERRTGQNLSPERSHRLQYILATDFPDLSEVREKTVVTARRLLEKIN